MAKQDTGKKALSALSRRQLLAFKYYRLRKPKIQLLHGSVRSGKTFVNNLIWHDYVLSFQNQGKKFIMSGATKASLERNVLIDFQNDFEIETHLDQSGTFKMYGNTIHCFGSDKIDNVNRIKGMTAQGHYGNEITKHHPEFVREVLSRCSGKGSRLFWDTNPEHPQHFINVDYVKKSGEKLRSGSELIKAIHFILSDNPLQDPDYIDMLESIPYNTAYYQRNVKGIWAGSGKLIYVDNWEVVDDFDIDITKYVSIKTELNYLVGGMDFGSGGEGESAFVLMGKKDGYWDILKEVKAIFRTNAEFVDAVQRCFDNIKLQAVKKNTRIFADNNALDKINEFANAGFDIVGVKKGAGSVLRGIELVQRSKLRIRKECVNTIFELQKYEWKINKDGFVLDEPRKADDHISDSIRYGIYSQGLDYENKTTGAVITSRRDVGRYPAVADRKYRF